MIENPESFFKNKKIFLTGGTGYVGSVLLKKLAAFDCEILVLSRCKPVEPLPGKAKIKVLTGDLQQSKDWIHDLKDVEIVFHLAGQSSSVIADQDPQRDYEINVHPTRLMLDFFKQQSTRPVFVFAGTVTQIGLSEYLPVDEKHPGRPLNFYDFHKQMAESYIKLYSRQQHVAGVSLRLPNIYGPGPSVGAADRGILNKMVKKAMAGEALTIFGDGSPVRDYLYIDDLVEAFLLAAQNARVMSGEHFILGTGKGYSLEESFQMVIAQVAEITGVKSKLEYEKPARPPAPIEQRKFVADIQKMVKITQWQPKIALKQGIQETIKAFL